MTSKKICLYSNYIPHHTPKRSLNFSKWFHEYKNDLYILYDEFSKLIISRYQEYNIKIRFENEETFLIFARIVYNNSSKR